jgi:hypothetical protein
MTKIISYPSGAFGNFLAYLLNYIVSGQRYIVDEDVYDFAQSEVTLFKARHAMDNCDVYINVSTESYLKFLITNVNRINGTDLIIEDLQFNTFDKIRSHRTLNYFEKSLTTISGKTQGDVSPKYIREWLRLCFFSNNAEVISTYVGNKPKASYVLDFDLFFSKNSIKHFAIDILNYFDFDIKVHNFDDIIEEFFSKQRYKNHIDTNSLKKSIQKNQNILLNLNIFEQAWLDNWLVEQYNIDPVLTDGYFNSTKDLINFYKIVDTDKELR